MLAVAGVLAVLLAGGSGFSIVAIKHFDNSLHVNSPPCVGIECRSGEVGGLPHVSTFCERNACNFLVLGSDSRAGLTPAQQKQFGSPSTVVGQRSDTIILVQYDPNNNRTIVLSIPRDLRVAIPGHGTNKINTAFSYGPDVLVQTVEKLTGLRINHYVEVNFSGFQDIVNALGGVPICIDKPLVDSVIDLNLPKAGCYQLNGAKALAFVRARHVQGDLIPDFSRIARQQQFIRALMQKAMSVGAIFHVAQFVDAAKHNMIIDKTLNIYDLQDLTLRLAKLGSQNVLFRVLPGRPVQIGGVDYVELVQPSASLLLQRIRDGKGLGSIGEENIGGAMSPAAVTVHVLDANSGGKAQQVYAYLQKSGFAVTPVQAAPAQFTKSEMLFGHGATNQKTLVNAYLASLDAVYDNADTNQSDITVVIGPDFKGVPS
jgi:LCP family protein required for cell wall assembly